MESWARTYPRDPVPHGLLAGFATSSTGRYELSIAAVDKALALDPDRVPSTAAKALNQIRLNRLADAEATLRRATDSNLEYPELALSRYFIAFLKGDVEDVRRKATRAREQRATADMISHLEALALARAGQLQEAKRTSAVAVDIAQQAGQRERAAMFDAATAVSDAFYGDTSAARRRATKRPRARQRPRRGLRRRLRTGARRRHDAFAGARRRPCEDLSRGHVGAIHLSADASAPCSR